MANPSSLPVFTTIPRLSSGQVSVANTNLDGTGTLVDIIQGAADGTRIDWVRVKAIVTTTVGFVRLFTYDGSNNRLIAEIPVTALTPSASVAAFEHTWYPPSDLILPDNTWYLRASTENAETMNVHASGGDF